MPSYIIITALDGYTFRRSISCFDNINCCFPFEFSSDLSVAMASWNWASSTDGVAHQRPQRPQPKNSASRQWHISTFFEAFAASVTSIFAAMCSFVIYPPSSLRVFYVRSYSHDSIDYVLCRGFDGPPPSTPIQGAIPLPLMITSGVATGDKAPFQ